MLWLFRSSNGNWLVATTTAANQHILIGERTEILGVRYRMCAFEYNQRGPRFCRSVRRSAHAGFAPNIKLCMFAWQPARQTKRTANGANISIYYLSFLFIINIGPVQAVQVTLT